MSSFTGFNASLGLTYNYEPEKNKEYWSVIRGFEYYLENDPSIIVQIPHGFLTDGASIPKGLNLLLPPWGPYGQAAVLHDYLLTVGRMRNAKGHFVYCSTRTEARRHFRDAMRILKVPTWSSTLLNVGVWLWDQFKSDKLR